MQKNRCTRYYSLQSRIELKFGSNAKFHKIKILLSNNKLSKKLSLDRTTLQKVLKRFVDNELVERFQENLDNGGYIFIYQIKDKVILKKRIHTAIDKWYDTAKIAIDKW